MGVPEFMEDCQKGSKTSLFLVVFFLHNTQEETMYLMIDNYDSFVYNLACYLEECGEKVMLIRNDKISISEIENLLSDRRLEGLILSPGPKSPKDCGNCKEILDKTAGKIPVLGVCLGHQIIGDVFGAYIKKGIKPMHGKVTQIRNNQTGLFEGSEILFCNQISLSYCF